MNYCTLRFQTVIVSLFAVNPKITQMKKLVLFIACAVSGLNVSAQSENALYFDNIDDHVTAPNASATIANINAISMTMWIYPQNAAPAFPDYDGFGGFRNNSNAVEP